jgi:hypothetical protein
MTDNPTPKGSANPKPQTPCGFEFVVEQTAAGWMVSGCDDPLGPFHYREQAVDLAEGMAQALRQIGETAAVRILPAGRRPGDRGPSN